MGSFVALASVKQGPPAAEEKLPLPKLDPDLRKRLVSYLETHHRSPEDYIASKFADHDIVFVGEYHRIKHNPQLIAKLVPVLHRKGVTILGIEFARFEDQPLIDKLLSGNTYDEAIAREVQFRSTPEWSYQEYLDIYRAAWKLNSSMPARAKKFRIMGLGCSPNWSLVKTPEDWDNPKVRVKVWPPGGPDKFMADVIQNQILAKGEKALVYCGRHHAFTEYQQPIVDEKAHKFIRFETERAGNFIYRSIGKRAITILLHAPWSGHEGYGTGIVYPADGAIDALLRVLPRRLRSGGFDTRGTPFGELTGATGIYSQGYEHFTLQAMCDGYVVEKPFSQFEGVTPAPGYLNAENIGRASIYGGPAWYAGKNPEELMKSIAEDANIKKQFARLH